MKNILIISHGPLAQGLLESSKLFFGEQEQLEALCLQSCDAPETFTEQIKQALEKNQGNTLVLCDILFGTPCNCVARLLDEYPDVQVLTGVNLSMLLQALSNRDSSIEELQTAANHSIAYLNDLLKES